MKPGLRLVENNLLREVTELSSSPNKEETVREVSYLREKSLCTACYLRAVSPHGFLYAVSKLQFRTTSWPQKYICVIHKPLSYVPCSARLLVNVVIRDPQMSCAGFS